MFHCDPWLLAAQCSMIAVSPTSVACWRVGHGSGYERFHSRCMHLTCATESHWRAASDLLIHPENYILFSSLIIKVVTLI